MILNVNRNISKNDFERKICELINRAETFIQWAEKLLSLYDRIKKIKCSPIEKCNLLSNRICQSIVLHHVLYFQEVVLLLETIFEKKNSPEEISFKFYMKNYLTNKEGLKSFYSKYSIVEKKYKKLPLSNFRNRLFAHKNIESSGDPVAGFLNPAENMYVENIKGIIKEIKTIPPGQFACSSNNYFKDFYEPGFEFLFSSFKDEIKKIEKQQKA